MSSLEQIAADLAQLERRHAAELAALVERQARDRVALLARAQPSAIVLSAPEPPNDLIPAGDAAAMAKRAKSTLAAWCRRHAIDGERGFAMRIGARWFVSKSRLKAHLSSDLRV